MIQAPKGTKDVLPQLSGRWHTVEAVIRDCCKTAGYREIRTPVFEHTELFARGVGDTTDVVQKEMYTFTDKGDRSVTLKPEGTAGAARMLIEHGLYNDALPIKMYYQSSPMFRYEAPQSGRLREFHQFGIEVFGAKDASVDAEGILLAMRVIRRLGVKGLKLHINSIGCPACRPKYQQALRDFFAPKLEKMCGACKERFERNPLRLLDCKVPFCKQEAVGAPEILSYLCPDCEAHFNKLKALLDAADQPYTVDTGIVRGLDYYTKSVFEIIAVMPDGNELTVCGGGRYDGLVETLGGPALPATGFGMGIERLLTVMEAQGLFAEEPPLYTVYVAPMGEAAAQAAFTLVEALRESGVSADCDHASRSLKAQFKYAGKLGSPYVVVIGDEELANSVYKLRDMATKEELTLTKDELIARFA